MLFPIVDCMEMMLKDVLNVRINFIWRIISVKIILISLIVINTLQILKIPVSHVKVISIISELKMYVDSKPLFLIV